MSPGSLSFAKLVVMLFGPAKSAGMPDTYTKIHSFNQPCPIQSRVQSAIGVFLSTSNTIMHYLIKRAENITHNNLDSFYFSPNECLLNLDKNEPQHVVSKRKVRKKWKKQMLSEINTE